MISTWSEWKRYPRAGRGDNIEAPITPGIYEVRVAGTGALHSFGAVDNVAQALALLSSVRNHGSAAATPPSCPTSNTVPAQLPPRPPPRPPPSA